MEIKIDISMASAIRAGRAVSGIRSVEVTDADLGTLSAEEREELIRLLGQRTPIGITLIPEPTFIAIAAEVRNSLAARVAQRVQTEEARTARENERREQYAARGVEALISGSGNPITDCPADLLAEVTAEIDRRRVAEQRAAEERIARHVEAVEAFEAGGDVVPQVAPWTPTECDRRVREEVTRRENAVKARKAEAITAWLAEHGTDSQKARFSEGLLPEADLMAAVRDHVFASLADQPRYEKLTAEDIEHGDDCHSPCHKYVVEDATELDADEFALLTVIRALAPDGATVQPRKHEGWCAACMGGSITSRLSALVTVDWHGTALSREYAL